MSKLPSPRTTSGLAAAILGVGIAVGVALGPGPGSSLAKDSALTPQALLALRAHASAQTAATDAARQPAPAPLDTTSHTKGSTASKPNPASNEVPSPNESGPPESPEAPRQGESQPSHESGSGSSSPAATVKPPPIKHVWVIAVTRENIDAALHDPNSQPYLIDQLLSQGTLLRDYELTAASELSNEMAVLAGQGVNVDTEQNCPTYGELQPPAINPGNGLAEGVGCVYPKQVQTLADELTDAGLSWRAYIRGLQPAPATPAPPSTPQTPSAPSTASALTCRHPQLGEADPNHTPSAADSYTTYSNPFVYFDSLLESGACAGDDLDLSRMAGDLAPGATSPSLSWVSPGACSPSSTNSCTPASHASETDSFLRQTVPQILASAAYKQSGLIAIVPVSAPTSDASGSSPRTTIEAPLGALLISPFVHRKASTGESFNDFSLSKSLARLYGVLPLGHANGSTVDSFGTGVYSTTEKAAQAASPAGG